MREILFRGKRKDNGEWAYGYLSQDTIVGADICKVEFVIHTPCETPFEDKWYEIDPATVGQYTGLTDNNGKKIFEGDVVKCTDKINDYEFMAVVLFGNPNGRYDWGFQLKQISGEKVSATYILLWVDTEEAGAYIEVIGNIHDNPELLEVIKKK